MSQVIFVHGHVRSDESARKENFGHNTLRCCLRHVITVLLLSDRCCCCCHCRCYRCHHHCHHVVAVVIIIVASSSSSSLSLPSRRRCCCCCHYHVIAVIAINAYSFRQYMNNIVRAYRNQAVDLIGICRLFS